MKAVPNSSRQIPSPKLATPILETSILHGRNCIPCNAFVWWHILHILKPERLPTWNTYPLHCR